MFPEIATDKKKIQYLFHNVSFPLRIMLTMYVFYLNGGYSSDGLIAPHYRSNTIYPQRNWTCFHLLDPYKEIAMMTILLCVLAHSQTHFS